MAEAAGASHKSFVRVGGVPMLARVIDALCASPWVGRTVICVEDPDLLASVADVGAAVDGAGATVVRSERTPSRSALRAIEALDEPFPVLVTTADHALLSSEMVDFFCAETLRTGAAVVAALASAAVVERSCPHSQRTYLRFRDDRYCGCNLFAFTEPDGARAATRLWQHVGRHRKRPWRLVRAFGLAPLMLFLANRLTLDAAMRRLSGQLGVAAAAVRMPFPEAAIDIDKAADIDLVEAILAARGTNEAAVVGNAPARGDRPRKNR